MTPITAATPVLVPVLSRGRHRTPRQGACFMEFASFLAGERWSDHPACTHPALAHLARGVNDLVSNGARGELAPLIPSVIGLTGAGDRIPAVVLARAAAAALPVASETRQRTLAAGLQHLLERLDETDAALALELGPDIRASLALAPAADRWARRFRGAIVVRRPVDLDTIALTITSVAVVGIAEACIPDADARLIALLDRAIRDCTPAAVAEPAREVVTAS